MAELKLWSFYRALITEFIATLLFLHVTVVDHKKQTGPYDSVGLLGIAWAFGGMIFILVYCTADISAFTKKKKQIPTTNAQNGRIVDMKLEPLLHVIKRTMHLATTGISGIAPLEDPGVPNKKILSKISLGNMHDLLVDTVSKISCEISCKCSDMQATTKTIIETLSSYPLEAQIVVALAAFAVNYGNFWLVGQLSQTNELAKYVTLLQQLPSVSEPADTLKLKFKALNDVIKAVLDVTDCIFEFKDLPPQFISRDTPPLSTAIAYICHAAYVIIHSIVICSSHINQLISPEIMDPSRVEPLELSSQLCAVRNIHEKLKTQLVICQKHVETAKADAAVKKFVKLFEATYTDNQTVVSTMFAADNHESLLIDSSNTMIDVGKLKGKNVLLFISDLNVTREELSCFHRYVHDHWKIEEMEYQFVWVQMVESDHQWTTELQNQCVEKLNSLPWCLVCNPTRLNRGLIRYIMEDWHFKYGKPQMVMLDHQGKVVSYNAIPDGGILKEWSIQSLAAASFDPWITQWVQAGEIICLYGGDNIQWIENFNKKVKAFEGKTYRTMKMLYVGKSNRKENVGNCVKKFVSEENKEAFMEKIWLFWLRLGSTWDSNMQSINNKSEGMKDDNIMKEILTMLSFDGSNQGWALISDCSSNMAKGRGDLIETCLDEYEKWMVDVKADESFVPKLNEYLHAMIFDDHCCLPVILPSTIHSVPDVVPCIICDKPMKKMATYRCCKD